MLPGLDGLSIVKTLRAEGRKTPILILSALGEVDDRVEGLTRGGDDYLVKPFAFSELLARLEALIRRRDGESPGNQAPGGRPRDGPPRPPREARGENQSTCSRGSFGCWNS